MEYLRNLRDFFSAQIEAHPDATMWLVIGLLIVAVAF